jgi:hypothetical protein
MTVRLQIRRPRFPLKSLVVIAALVSIYGLIAWAQQPVSVANTPAVTQSSGPWTMNLTQIAGAALGLGQTTMAASLPVTLASNQSSLAVSFSPSTSSSVALSRFHAATAAAANVKASAGNLYGMVLGNSGTIPCWIQFMNTASAPTAGTSVLDSYMVQAGVTLTIPPGALGMTNYTTGIGIAGATADSGATTTGCTTTMSVTIYYQ